MTPNKRAKLDFSDVAIIVGNKKQKFVVHKSFIKSSKLLETCCNGPWRESKANIIRLLEIRSDIFTIYLQWLYTNEIVTARDEENDTLLQATSSETKEPKSSKVASWYFKTLLKLVVLGDQLDDSTFRNRIIDSVIKYAERIQMIPRPTLLQSVCKDLPESSLFRKLLVDIYAAFADPESLHQFKADFPPDFSFEVMIALMNARTANIDPPTPRFSERCKYHEHGAGEPRCEPTSTGSVD